MEHNIVTFISVIIAVSFTVNIFFYGMSEGIWATFGMYSHLFDKITDVILGVLDSIFM